jgi:hypothetical protein
LLQEEILEPAFAPIRRINGRRIVKRSFRKLCRHQRFQIIDLEFDQMEEGPMNDFELSQDDKLCLRLWFRQALAKLEKEEVSEEFVRFHGLVRSSEDGHRKPVGRRTRRKRRVSHVKELVY